MLVEVNVTSEAVTEPVTLTEAKAHLRVTHTSEDALITDLITAARQWCEKYLQRSLAAKTLTVYYAGLSEATLSLNLFYPPIASFTSLTAIDWENNETACTYKVSPTNTVRLGDGGYFSTEDSYQAVYVTGALTDEVLKRGLLMAIADMYEVRQNESDVQYHLVSNGTKRYLSPYKIVTI